MPLDFVVAPHAVNYPFDYGSEEEINLYPFQLPIYIDDIPAVHQWIQRQGPVFGQESEQTYVILDKINRAIANGFTYLRREEPGVQSPGTTLKLGSGSCRDYAVLFMETCRTLGLAEPFRQRLHARPRARRRQRNDPRLGRSLPAGSGLEGV